jgi:HSF-type DNA-binding
VLKGFDSYILQNEYNNFVIANESRGLQEPYNIIEAKKLDLLCQSLMASPGTSLVNILSSHKLRHYPPVNALNGFSTLRSIKPEITYGIEDMLRTKPLALNTSMNGPLSSLRGHSINLPLISEQFKSGVYSRRIFPSLDALPVEPLQFHNVFSSAITECSDSDRFQNLPASNHSPQRFENFPMKLHRLLFELDSVPGQEGIVQFLPEGNAFEILDLARFKDVLMKRYFPRMKSFASFQRQLNNYCFRRLLNFPDRVIYHHPNFHRDYPSFCRKIKRSISRIRHNEI